MSGESAQDIEVSITAPNRSFHATVIASDVSWQDRGVVPQLQQEPLRPRWSSAFGNSTDTEDYDPMVNSATSLSQDSYDGFAVEFVSSDYMNGAVATGASVAKAAASGAVRAPEASAAAFTGPTHASDAVSTSVEMRPSGFAETDRGSISCEMMTAKPVLVGNGHIPTGTTDATVTSSSTTVTSSSTSEQTTVTSTTDAAGTTTVTSSGSAVVGTTVTPSTEGAVTTVTASSDESAVTTHAPMTLGSTFQMELVESSQDEQHAEAPERPRDRAMSLHERSLLAHDIHALASTMDTIRDEEEEVPVGSSTTDEKQPDEAYTPNRRQSLTGFPVSATTHIAHTQPTIFEAAENGAEAVEGEQTNGVVGETASSTSFSSSQYSSSMASSSAVTSSSNDAAAAPAADEGVSPYLRKLLDAQEQTRQLMALLGESTQMLGRLPSSKAEAEKEKAEAAVAEIASNLSVISKTSSSMTSSSAFSASSATAGAGATSQTTSDVPTVVESTTAVPQSPVPSASQAPQAVPASPTVVPQSPLAVPPSPSTGAPSSPALEISSRPVEITFDDASVVTPSAGAPPSFGSASEADASAPSADGTQNASICTALESLAANMTSVTTTSSESTSSSSSTVTTTAPITLSTPVLQLQPAASPTTSLSEEPFAAPPTPTPDTASLLHESTVQGLSVDLPSYRPTPEPDAERFVTNNEQSEATITKSSFSLDASTTSSASAETGSASTDYVLPTTSIVLTAADDRAVTPVPTTDVTADTNVAFTSQLSSSMMTTSAVSDGPASPVPDVAHAAAPEPTLTPAAVDLPVEIVRHLDDAASWHSAPSVEGAESGATAVPIAVVPAPSGPPPLAREPAPEAEPPRGPPPPLARETEEHHELSRSVMIERRVLSPDHSRSGAAPAPEAGAAPVTTITESEQKQPTTDTFSSTEQKPAVEPAASTEIPVTVWKPETEQATVPTPTPSAVDEAPLQVVLQPALSQQQQSEAKQDALMDIPVTVVPQGAEPTVTQPEVTPAAGDVVSVPVTVVQVDQKAEEEATVPAAPVSSADSQQQISEESAGTANPVSVWQPVETVSAPAVPQLGSQDSQATTVSEVPAATEIPVSVWSDTTSVPAEPQQASQDLGATTVSEVPVASAAAQEQPQQAAASEADTADGITTISPTTSNAHLSLESTFQISPSDEEAAHPPTMLRDRAMSIHEKSLLSHEPSSGGFVSGLEPLPEHDEVHVANAGALEATRRRASVAPGIDGIPTAGFQVPSTSCLFAIDEADSEAPASTPSPPSGGEESTTIASSSTDVIDVTATEAAPAAAPPPQPSAGVKWLTESEAGALASHELTPDSPATTVVAATPPQPEAAAAEAPQTPKTPTGVSSFAEPKQEEATSPVATTTQSEAPQTPKSPAAGVTFAAEPAQAATPVAATPATPTSQPDQAPPATPSTPTDVSWVTKPATITTSEPPQTPRTPTGASFTTDPSVPTTTEPVQTVSENQVPPQTPKTPTGVSWVTEPATTPSTTESVQAVPESQAPPQTPKTPTDGVSWITEPSSTAPTEPAQSAQDSQVPQTPKTPTGVSWITEPATTAAPKASQPSTEAAPPTPKTPQGVSWITEPASAQAASGAPDGASGGAAAPAAAPSVINITASPDSGLREGRAASPLTPTSPGIKWASDTTRTGGNADAAGAPPAPAESTFVVNAPWEGADAPPPAASAPDADGVTWITEKAGSPKEEEQKSRPPLTRSESTRSEREASSATDVTVRAATPTRKTLAPSVSGEEESLTNGVTQESLGTKTRKLSWADQQGADQPPSGAEDSFSAAIDDYEKKLNETTAQTKELVDLLCQTGSQITANSMKMSDVFSDAVQASVRSMLDHEKRDRAAAALSPIAENGESLNREPPPQLIAGALPPNVESVIVSCPELKYVTGSLVLENAHILVTDEESGLFLFTLDSKVVRHITNPLWKSAASPVIFKDRLKGYILVLMDCKDEEDGAWVRHIVKFSENLDFIEKVECPKWIRERTILSDRLAINRYENIYYCANGELFSGLYELAATGKWTELLYRQSESFVDMLAFAIIGPIQQILIVEGRRDHVLLCSIRESQCVEARRMAICERPGALARDESGRLFVMNRSQAAIQIVDTRVWAACRNMALVDKFVPHFSAAFGMLVIPQKRAVKVHKYSFEWDD